jgi:carbonyl reductase 1
MARKVIAVVTGSNRGIGAGIVAALAQTQHPKGALVIYATSRAGQTQEIPTQHDNEVRFAKLDISNKPSIKDFLRLIVKEDRAEGGGGNGVEILINNAGINLNRDETYESAEKTIDVNYRGVRDMCQLFLDAGNMKENSSARIVNVSSTGSKLGIHGKAMQERFRSVQTVQDVDALADEYLKLYKEKKLGGSDFGSGNISYQVSKACVNALTKVLAKEYQETGLLINCCCPGWVNTDMGKIVGQPSKSVEHGARIPVRLAVDDIDGVTGEYWSNDGVNDSGHGKVQRW